MEIERLNSEVVSKLRSSFSVGSVSQCVFELVCNSLDAKSTSIAIRLNLITFKIQVADNGKGITKDSMKSLGARYMTNKCHNVAELKKEINFYGFRGEALANIVENSTKVTITSRSANSIETYRKILIKNEENPEDSILNLIKQRPSAGTTVTVFGFLNNLPVRQKKIVQKLEMETVKKCIESLILINPAVSFSLRNDVTGMLILNTPKHKCILDAFLYLNPDIIDSFSLLKVLKKRMRIEALIHKDLTFSKNYQYIYINKRPIIGRKLQKHLQIVFRKYACGRTRKRQSLFFDTRKQYPMYVIHIKCPSTYVDVTIDPKKIDVEIRYWDLVADCLERVVKSFFGYVDEKKEKIVKNVRMENYGLSDVLGAVQVSALKRKSDENIAETTKKRKLNLKPVEDGIVLNKQKNYRMKCVKKTQEDEVEEEEEEEKGQIKSILKKPVIVKAKKQKSKEDSPLVNNEKPELLVDDQKSIYSKLEHNENNGKNLIMDMFLKSTLVYKENAITADETATANEDINSSSCRSNKFYAVNTPPPPPPPPTKQSACIQTSICQFENLANLPFECIQTTNEKINYKHHRHRLNSNLSDLTGKIDGINLEDTLNTNKLKNDYTISIEMIKNQPVYKFIHIDNHAKSSANQSDFYQNKNHGIFFHFPNIFDKSQPKQHKVNGTETNPMSNSNNNVDYPNVDHHPITEEIPLNRAAASSHFHNGYHNNEYYGTVPSQQRFYPINLLHRQYCHCMLLKKDCYHHHVDYYQQQQQQQQRQQTYSNNIERQPEERLDSLFSKINERQSSCPYKNMNGKEAIEDGICRYCDCIPFRSNCDGNIYINNKMNSDRRFLMEYIDGRYSNNNNRWCAERHLKNPKAYFPNNNPHSNNNLQYLVPPPPQLFTENIDLKINDKCRKNRCNCGRKYLKNVYSPETGINNPLIHTTEDNKNNNYNSPRTREQDDRNGKEPEIDDDGGGGRERAIPIWQNPFHYERDRRNKLGTFNPLQNENT